MFREPAKPNQVHRDALRGHALPPDFICNNDVGIDICVRHGIRYNESFAKSREVEELCHQPNAQSFARARNARLIMSNSVPDMATNDVKPYCIWHPDVATEETYRKLAKRYPDMRYHVARACAVAGYAELYRELEHVLPDISVAEEARHNCAANEGSAAIFREIMSQPVCYAVMNDFTRSVNLDSPRSPAFMNGDTAVKSLLDQRLGLDRFRDWFRLYFDIAEDHNSAETTTAEPFGEPLAPSEVALLYTPLPPHLPTTNKDPFIIMAAYEGNVDRYARLRRPFMVPDELYAVIRGVYHSTTFAKWWAQELQGIHEERSLLWGADKHHIMTACTGRFIMVNDLSLITPTSPRELPAMIWWPLLPAEATLRELVSRRPDACLQVAMACVAGDYRALWDELAPEPSVELHEHARGGVPRWDKRVVRNYYTDYLESKCENGDINLAAPSAAWRSEASEEPARRDKEPTTTTLSDGIYTGQRVLVEEIMDWEESIYPGGRQANAAKWELFMCASEDLRQLAVKNGEVELYNSADEGWEEYKASLDGGSV